MLNYYTIRLLATHLHTANNYYAAVNIRNCSQISKDFSPTTTKSGNVIIQELQNRHIYAIQGTK